MEECMSAAGVSLTKDDVNKVVSLFAEAEQDLSDTRKVMINYFKMSVDMGL